MAHPASEMTYTVSGGALNSTQTKPNQGTPRGPPPQIAGKSTFPLPYFVKARRVVYVYAIDVKKNVFNVFKRFFILQTFFFI